MIVWGFGELIKKLATKAGIEPATLRRKGRMARIVEARDRFMQSAVFEEGYLASEVNDFLACHPANVSRALQKDDRVNSLRQVCHRTSPLRSVEDVFVDITARGVVVDIPK